MKKQIQSIQKYFKDKLLSGEYEVTVPTSEHITELIIDEEFKFSIWTSNGGFEQYISSYDNFIKLPDFSKQEVVTARTKLDPRLKQLQEEIKLKQIQELENKIQKLKS